MPLNPLIVQDIHKNNKSGDFQKNCKYFPGSSQCQNVYNSRDYYNKTDTTGSYGSTDLQYSGDINNVKNPVTSNETVQDRIKDEIKRQQHEKGLDIDVDSDVDNKHPKHTLNNLKLLKLQNMVINYD